QVAVEFDRRQRTVAVEQRQGQRALAGTDLDDAIARPRIDGQHDLLDHRFFVQEVLSQVLLRIAAEAVGIEATAAVAPARVATAHARPPRASIAQVRIAASRLDGSARPLPARSSAVPWSTATRG